MLSLLMLMLMGCLPKQTLHHNNLERDYFVHVPKELPADAPLVFFLHGYKGNARIYSLVGMKKQADELGFVVAFPQGTETSEGKTYWNAQLTIGDTDDIGYLSELAAHLQGELGLDPTRTYATGISNGGFMSYTLACQAPEVFHGVGSVIGTMSGETWQTCPEASVPIFQLSGTEDDVVPIDGSMDPENGWGGAPEMTSVIERWAKVNGCTETVSVDVDDQGATTGTRHTGCESGAEVLYFEVDGMGHELPKWGWQAELSRFLMTLPAPQPAND